MITINTGGQAAISARPHPEFDCLNCGKMHVLERNKTTSQVDLEKGSPPARCLINYIYIPEFFHFCFSIEY